MLFRLAVPILRVRDLARIYLQLYTPSNVLARRVRFTAPRLRDVAGLLGLAATLFTAMHALTEAVAAGAPGWLSIIAIVLAWDAIKIRCPAACLGVRCMWGSI